MGKLVRDRIPDIMRADGLEPETRVLGEGEYLLSLFEKLIEESHELQEAAPSRRLEEAADVWEVLTTLVDVLGLSMRDVELQAHEKRTQRGGFNERIWLEAR